jgi:hypothetical protein
MSEAELEVDFTVQAVENLVTQFSAALDFYRELVQNSIDAGTAQVEVWMEYLPGDEDAGTIAIHVDDGGEGMNEEIIDNQLTRLFASSKAGDLTKIGKFGIGFVSIFAPNPKAVLLHSGRGGEYWELLFHPDRSFTKSRIDGPVEGTQITLFLAGDRGRYRQLVADSLTTLRRWCVHSEVEVTFEDRSFGAGPVVVNGPFAVEGRCPTHASAEGTEVALAYSREPVCGFYNKGLALTPNPRDRTPALEHSARLQHVSFKVKSRWLEHTLSRDTVVREGNFHKAMALVVATAAGALQEALIKELERLCGLASWGAGELALYYELLEYLRAEPMAEVERWRARPILRRVDGAACSLDAIEAQAREEEVVFVRDGETAVASHLLAKGVPVLLAATPRALGDGLSAMSFGAVGALLAAYLEHRRAQGVHGVLRRFGIGAGSTWIAAPEQVYLPIREVEGSAQERALLAEALRLLERSGGTYGRLVACTIEAPDAPMFVIARKIEGFMRRPPPSEGPFGWWRPRRPEAAIDIRHPQFAGLLRLSQEEPAMAAFCLAKALLVAEDAAKGRAMTMIEAALAEVKAAYHTEVVR